MSVEYVLLYRESAVIHSLVYFLFPATWKKKIKQQCVADVGNINKIKYWSVTCRIKQWLDERTQYSVLFGVSHWIYSHWHRSYNFLLNKLSEFWVLPFSSLKNCCKFSVLLTFGVHSPVSWPATGDCGWSKHPHWRTQTWQGWRWTACGPSCICKACQSSFGRWCVGPCLWTWWSPQCPVSKSKWHETGTHRHGRGWSGGWSHTFLTPEKHKHHHYLINTRGQNVQNSVRNK